MGSYYELTVQNHTMTEPYPGTKSALRAITLLKTFTDSKSEWGLTELSEEVGLNKTTTYRLLTALKSEGMVTQNPQTQAYRLGPAIIALGARALRSNDLRSASRPELEQLAADTGETASLEVLVGDHVLILDEVLGAHLVGTSAAIGTRWPAHATSTGRILLAHQSDDARDTILMETDWPALTAETTTDPDALRRELIDVREQGYAVVVGELEANFVAIGAPIHSYTNDVVAAVSVGGPRSRLTAERTQELVTRVQAAAERISQQLGHYA